tara:strand:- start:476 stop:1114 length:639 start_codon:yes stop_codon:yes gene_type:complete
VENGQKALKIQNKRFIYLISPNRIANYNFYTTLDRIFSTKKVKYFQLRLKKESFVNKVSIAKKIFKICKKYKVKLLINDDPYLALKINADGCHLGQNDMDIIDAKKILKKKIIGITCHNSVKLAKKAFLNKANYIAIGAFNKSKTKRVKHIANLNTLKKIKKFIKIPIVVIGGINDKNYKKLLLNNADFLAISSYIWKNNNYKPYQAIKNFL